MTVRRLLHISAFLLAAAALALANPGVPGPATVHVARAEKIMVPEGISAPRLLYPQGRVDFDVVDKLVDTVAEAVTGLPRLEAWRKLFLPSDRVGIMVDAGKYPVQLATVESVIDRLVGAGVEPSNIVVFSGDERELFAAGFSITHDQNTVRVLGTDSEGFRGGISRVISDYCDVYINLACLEADPDLEFTGLVFNALNCVPNAQRVQLRKDPLQLPMVAAAPVLRQKLRLCLLEAYVPLLATEGQDKVTYAYGALVGGTDPVAVDVVGREVLRGCLKAAGRPQQAPATDYLKIAQERYRLGQSDRAAITVKLQGHSEGSFLD